MGDHAVHARSFASLWLAGLVSLTLGCVSVPGANQPKPTPAEAAEASRNVGIDHVVNGRVALGIRDLRHAMTVYPDDALTNMWLGQAYLLKGRLDDSLVHAERAVELDPMSHEARLNLSVIDLHMGRYSEAVSHADLLVDDPTFASPWRALTNRGWAQLKQRQLTLARRSLEEALEYRPRYWPALLNLGILEQIEGDRLASLRYLEAVRELEPGSGAVAEANYRMAEAYVSLGHRERALHHLEEAIEASPHGRWGRQSREYLALLQ